MDMGIMTEPIDKEIEEEKDATFRKGVELVMSMSTDFLLTGKLTKKTYISNLRLIANNLEENV